jgi:hypothetical protein
VAAWKRLSETGLPKPQIKTRFPNLKCTSEG